MYSETLPLSEPAARAVLDQAPTVRSQDDADALLQRLLGPNVAVYEAGNEEVWVRTYDEARSLRPYTRRKLVFRNPWNTQDERSVMLPSGQAIRENACARCDTWVQATECHDAEILESPEREVYMCAECQEAYRETVRQEINRYLLTIAA